MQARPTIAQLQRAIDHDLHLICKELDGLNPSKKASQAMFILVPSFNDMKLHNLLAKLIEVWLYMKH